LFAEKYKIILFFIQLFVKIKLLTPKEYLKSTTCYYYHYLLKQIKQH